MPLFAMPIILNVEADSLSEAQEAVELWGEDLEIDSCPEGTESFDVLPACDMIEGQRVLYLPAEDDFSQDDDLGEDDEDEDSDDDDKYEELDSDEL